MFTIAIDHASEFLVIAASGPAGLVDMCATVDVAACVAAMQGRKRVLIDFLDAQPRLSFTDHLELGTHGAAKLGMLERVATVTRAANRSGVSEKAAQHQGLRLKAFTDLAQALAWLRQ
jgi:hypothetical protein